eukprot:4432062-Prymnesium_polylepis.1
MEADRRCSRFDFGRDKAVLATGTALGLRLAGRPRPYAVKRGDGLSHVSDSVSLWPRDAYIWPTRAPASCPHR